MFHQTPESQVANPYEKQASLTISVKFGTGRPLQGVWLAGQKHLIYDSESKMCQGNVQGLEIQF